MTAGLRTTIPGWLPATRVRDAPEPGDGSGR